MANLESLYRRIEHEQGDPDRYAAPLKVIDATGNRYEFLSLNWDDEAGEWVLVGDFYG